MGVSGDGRLINLSEAYKLRSFLCTIRQTEPSNVKTWDPNIIKDVAIRRRSDVIIFAVNT